MRALILSMSLFGTLPAHASPERCDNLWNNVALHYRELFKALKSPEKDVKTSSAVTLARLPDKACSQKDPDDIIALVELAASRHAGRIGVLLNPKDPREKAMMEAMEAHFPNNGVAFSERVVLRSTTGHPEDWLRGLAELVFREEVGILIGGAARPQAKDLASWATKLKIPAFVLAPEAAAGAVKSRYVFHVFPSQVTMARKLAAQMKKNGVKKLGILRPAQTDATALTFALTEQLGKLGIDASQHFVYMNADFPSMEDAANKLFKISRAGREEEYKELYDKAQEEAKEKKVPFNPEQVVLPPVVDVDAIFLPDNFRTVRHLVKIFQFLGVKGLPLYGSQQWRAPELLQPPEPFLQNAVFADYIGKFDHLPGRLTVPNAGTPDFVAPSAAPIVDFQIIAYLGIMIADQAIQPPAVRRFQLAAKIKNMSWHGERFLADGRLFPVGQTLHWPAFLMRVDAKGLTLLQN